MNEIIDYKYPSERYNIELNEYQYNSKSDNNRHLQPENACQDNPITKFYFAKIKGKENSTCLRRSDRNLIYTTMNQTG